MARERKDTNTEMAEAARQLFVKYGGRQIRRIEREMREAGWEFSKYLLYMQSRDKTNVGWIERFRWRDAPGVPPAKKGSAAAKGIARPFARRRKGPFERWLLREQTTETMTWTWPYQRYLCDRLAQITSGKTNRLMIFMPPRHGKSEMVTIRYVAWRIMQDPKLNVILGSYNQRLANKFSRRIQRTIDDQRAKEKQAPASDDGEQTEAPPVRRSRAVAEWETMGGGVVRAVGVGGGIAGFGAGLVVIDDPVRNRADAESESKRETVDDWFKSDIYTRLEPKAAIILIQTRWHEDDLAGRLLREMKEDGEEWDVVWLPAIAEEAEADENKKAMPADPLGRKPGEALCPKRYNAKALARIKRNLGSYAFSAMYQQRPRPRDGGQFKPSWFKIVDYMPVGLDWKRGYDLAVSTRQTADYTASFRVAMDKNGSIYIADGYRAKIEYPEQRRYIIDRMKNEERTEHGIEAALHGKAVVQDLRTEPGSLRFALKEIRVASDKLARALPWLNLAEAGKVILVRGPWVDAFLDEISTFPTGRHDDQVDAVSTAMHMLKRTRGSRAAGF